MAHPAAQEVEPIEAQAGGSRYDPRELGAAQAPEADPRRKNARPRAVLSIDDACILILEHVTVIHISSHGHVYSYINYIQ